ncbi:hypothetical protein GF323_02135 [Candidatus Woesearchaeota archaeon]|nr:hypothetical protein [Candidatus Woesearchaeota archaeon]
MKLLNFSGILILAALITACTSLQQGSLPTGYAVAEHNTVIRDISQPDVRLTAEGFDTGKAAVNKGEYLTIMITGNLKGHYLTLEGDRISDKHLAPDTKVIIPFDEAGTFEVVDQTSKQSLSVVVE